MAAKADDDADDAIAQSPSTHVANDASETTTATPATG
jgi:hypothetical protein